jgi:hypothetical protein
MAQHALHASPSTESWSIGKSKIDFVHSKGGEPLARSLPQTYFTKGVTSQRGTGVAATQEYKATHEGALATLTCQRRRLQQER